jgi:hypothetical protein
MYFAQNFVYCSILWAMRLEASEHTIDSARMPRTVYTARRKWHVPLWRKRIWWTKIFLDIRYGSIILEKMRLDGESLLANLMRVAASGTVCLLRVALSVFCEWHCLSVASGTVCLLRVALSVCCEWHCLSVASGTVCLLQVAARGTTK